MSHLHESRPKMAGTGLWVRLTLADGSEVDGVLPSIDLLPLSPWREISLRFDNSESRTYTRASYQKIQVLGVIGHGHWRDKIKNSS